jgi:hypothetical protein
VRWHLGRHARLTSLTQVNHSAIVQNVTAVSRAFADEATARFWDPVTEAVRPTRDTTITHPVQTIA